MRYRVVAGMVTVETAVPDVPGARARRDVYRGSLLPTDVPASEVHDLLTQGRIVAEPEPEPARKPAKRAQSSK